MTDSQHVEVTITSTPEAEIVAPAGDIDLGGAPSFREHLASIQQRRPQRLIVDLAGVPYMDSSGVATLVEAMQTARRSGTRLVLCNLQSRVRSIFEIARLDSVFTIAATREDSLTA